MNDKLIAEGIVFDTTREEDSDAVQELLFEGITVEDFPLDRYEEQITLFDLEVVR